MEALTVLILFGWLIKLCIILGACLLLVIVCIGLTFLVPLNQTTRHPNLPAPNDSCEALEPGEIPLRR